MAVGEIVAGAIEGLAGLGFKAYDNYQENEQFEQQIKLAQQQYDLAEKEYYSNIDNLAFQQDFAIKNFGLQQETYDWNKQQRALTLQREDNAIQRQVNDLKNAGLSPLMVNNGSASSNAQVLNAPQYNGSDVNTAQAQVNQASSNRRSASEQKSLVYQRKLEQSNFNKRLQLENLQLSASMIETLDSVLNSSSRRRLEQAMLDKQLIENDWYNVHGYQPQDLKTILSDFLNRINKDGETPGNALAEALNGYIDSLPFNTSSKKNNSSVLTSDDFNKRVSIVSSLIKKAQKGNLSPIDINSLSLNMHKDGFDSGIPYGRWKSLSNQEAKDLLNRYLKFMEEKKKAQRY